MKAKIKQLVTHPMVPLFFAFLLVFSCLQLVLPQRERSAFEHRNLASVPAFSAQGLTDGTWGPSAENGLTDQFPLRDRWVALQRRALAAGGTIEYNGVWITSDGYQIAATPFFSDIQTAKLPLNTQAVSEFAARHPGQVNLMVVPSASNILSAKLHGAPMADENGALDSIYATAGQAGAGVIDLRDVYANHVDEQLYYRTDHHWTTTGGAWLAYEAYCTAVGLSPQRPSASLVSIDGFYGTNYARTQWPGTRADTLDYYDLPNTLTLYNQQPDGTLDPQETTVMNTEKLAGYDKYAAFLHGNNALSVLHGTGKGRLLVIKDSYANCFIPYLAANYSEIYIVDMRSLLSPTVEELMAEHRFDRTLILYSFDTFSNDPYLYRLLDDMQ